jgi:hypothetical protein
MAARALTDGEWAGLSPGLAPALRRAGVEPRIEQRAHPAAYLGALRFRSVPIMAVGRTIWWPRAGADLAGTGAMPVLQHELQHLLDYGDGLLTVAGYLAQPRHWTYRWSLDPPVAWERLGAEQRASMAEALWRAERSLAAADLARRLREAIPWARTEGT